MEDWYCQEKIPLKLIFLSFQAFARAGDETTGRDGFSRRLYTIVHLFEAEDESQQ